MGFIVVLCPTHNLLHVILVIPQWSWEVLMCSRDLKSNVRLLLARNQGGRGSRQQLNSYPKVGTVLIVANLATMLRIAGRKNSINS